jgi:hypothetical protein
VIIEIAVLTILTINIQITGRAVDLAAEALAEDVVTFITDMDSIANFEVKAEVMTIIFTAATYREVIYVEVTLRTKGLVMNIVVIIYINSLESTIFTIRKATSLYNIF